MKDLTEAVLRIEQSEMPALRSEFEKYVLIEELERIRSELAAAQPVSYHTVQSSREC